MSKFWSDDIRGLQPYIPGEQPQVAGLIKLNTNENPYPPSPAVLAAIREATSADLRLYPDPEGRALKQAIAELYGLDDAQIFVGNGSDEVLAHTFLALLKHSRPVLFPDVSYSFYPVYCALYGIPYETVLLDADFQVDPAGYMRPNGGIVLPNPNAPTGSAVGRDTIRALLENSPDSVVVIDEAYVDFGADSAVPLIEEFDNLLVVQTLSKSRSLAGLRVGFAMGQPPLIEALTRVKDSFNSYPLDRLALAGGEAAIRDREHFETTRQQVIQSREWLAGELAALGFQVLPSSANFLFVRHPQHDAGELLRQLRERRILVRHFKADRISQFLRISIGTMEACQMLIGTLGEILQ